MNLDHDYNEPRTMFIGRFQPLHGGHITQIRTILGKGEKVFVGIRQTAKDDKNPYNYSERWQMFYSEFTKEMKNGDIIVGRIPNITRFVYGRNVGYKVEEIRLPESIEEISATDIRNNQK